MVVNRIILTNTRLRAIHVNTEGGTAPNTNIGFFFSILVFAIATDHYVSDQMPVVWTLRIQTIQPVMNTFFFNLFPLSDTLCTPASDDFWLHCGMQIAHHCQNGCQFDSIFTLADIQFFLFGCQDVFKEVCCRCVSYGNSLRISLNRFNPFTVEFHKFEFSMLDIGSLHISFNKKFGKMYCLNSKQFRYQKRLLVTSCLT